MKLSTTLPDGELSPLDRTKAIAGSLMGYVWYAALMFGWYLLHNFYTSATATSAQGPLQTIFSFVYGYVLHPFVIAGVFGGIYGYQRKKGEWGISEFIGDARKYFWRTAAVTLLYTAMLLIGAMVIAIVASPEQSDRLTDAFLKYADIPISAITLFWLAAVITEGKVFPSLVRAVKAAIFTPLGLVVGTVWGLVCFADATFFDALTTPRAPVFDIADAAVLAVMKILTAVFAFAIYKQMRGDAAEIVEMDSPLPEAATAQGGERLIKVSFGFALAAFMPLVHVVALVLGILAIKRSKRFSLRSAIACVLGGFFTVFYALLIAGWAISASVPRSVPGYAFLAEADATLAPQVALLEQRAFQEALQRLALYGTGSKTRSWAVESAIAIAKYRSGDTDGALDAFHAAAEAKPDRSEFYYFYGLALLDNDQDALAAEQFHLAALHTPKLAQAERYASLIDSAYSPSRVLSALFFIVILLILFAFHEYGHALAAWKLGDDTAKNQGRLTLNPIKHLDLFGSIILPAILLFREASTVFGWAKPVPVNPANFKDPRRDHMRVSFAGPAVNLLISIACFIVISCLLLAVRLIWPETITLRFASPYGSLSMIGPPSARGLVVIIAFLKQLMYTSLALGFLNLLPVPPLDGSWILSGLLPERLRAMFDGLRRFGFVVFILLIITPAMDYYLLIPLELFWAGLQVFVSALGVG